MRNGKCPKCESQRIAVSSYVLYLGAGVSGPTIELYVCGECQYVEQYMQDSVEKRVAVLDSWRWLRPEPGPFRS